MKPIIIFSIIYILIIFISIVVTIYLIILVIKALKKYINSSDVRKEKCSIKKSLGEALKEHRTNCQMTQEFVAESIGVSRQAVSKWESGVSDPSTSNLFALAKLYNISAEDLLNQIDKTNK